MSTSGQRLGPYELLHPLGAGGMAETFVAVRRGPASFEQRVCLKRILPSCAATPVFVELFLDEARLLARLQCRNIVHVYDFGEVQGTYYMALELIDGLDLAHLLESLYRRGAMMPTSLALYVVSEVLAALNYAHTLKADGESLGIVHRDISPSNILVSNHGEVKLTDFGIAKARGRVHKTQTGHTKGKAAYMSPEQVRAGPIDARSDLFSLGVVLFELLTGVHPFDASTDLAIQLSIVSGKRPRLEELRPDLPQAVGRLLDALLATDPAHRPASAAAALAMLPLATSPFVLQQQLAQLVATRDTGGFDAPRVSKTARPRTLTEQEVAQAARALSGTLHDPEGVRAVGARGATVPERHGMRPGRIALWAACALLPLAAAYAFLFFERAPDVARSTLTLPEVPRTLPQGTEEIVPSTGLPGAQPLPIEEVISPPKRGVRARREPVERVVSPIKAEGGPRHDAPVEQVVSPAKSHPSPKPQPIELVISPPK